VGIFSGFQAAVAALIVRAVHRIGSHALNDVWLWGIAILSGAAQLLGASFLLTLGFAGLLYAHIKRQMPASSHIAAFMPLPLLPQAAIVATPPLLALFGYGLRSGLLTFGGAYTVIPFLQHDAGVTGGWMTNEQFLDGLALSCILPAPLIIFATFVGYLGGGPLGALALTAGIFLPAFAFTLVGHNYLERLVENKAAHAFLEGVTAGVVGLIAAVTVGLFRTAVTDLPALGIFAVALWTFYRWKAKAAVAAVVLGAGLSGLLLYPV
jgi:chromate transporter